MTRSLTGKVALVTGAAKGIGAGIAKAMSAAGASVAVNFVSDRPGAERVVADIKAQGGDAFAVQANVSVVADVTCREALKHFGTDGGSIINIGSMSSERFSAGAVAYTASTGITGVTGGPLGNRRMSRRVGRSALARRRKQQRRDAASVSRSPQA